MCAHVQYTFDSAWRRLQINVNKATQIIMYFYYKSKQMNLDRTARFPL